MLKGQTTRMQRVANSVANNVRRMINEVPAYRTLVVGQESFRLSKEYLDCRAAMCPSESAAPLSPLPRARNRARDVRGLQLDAGAGTSDFSAHIPTRSLRTEDDPDSEPSDADPVEAPGASRFEQLAGSAGAYDFSAFASVELGPLKNATSGKLCGEQCEGEY